MLLFEAPVSHRPIPAGHLRAQQQGFNANISQTDFTQLTYSSGTARRLRTKPE